jgi:4-hydroxybenzoate polyprenyltransferase
MKKDIAKIAYRLNTPLTLLKRGILDNRMKKYLSLVTFSHTIFAMPFAFIGFFLAVTTTNHKFEWQKLVMMVLCMVLARNSAMAFNRYLDRNIDAKNPRTKLRDIPAGRISPAAV